MCQNTRRVNVYQKKKRNSLTKSFLWVPFLISTWDPITSNYDLLYFVRTLSWKYFNLRLFLDIFDLLLSEIILNNGNMLLLWDCIPWNVYLIRRDCTWHGAHTSPPPQQDEDPFTAAAAWLMTLTCEVTEFMLWCCWRPCCNKQASLYWVTRLIKLLKMTMFRTRADK